MNSVVKLLKGIFSQECDASRREAYRRIASMGPKIDQPPRHVRDFCAKEKLDPILAPLKERFGVNGFVHTRIFPILLHLY